MSTQTETSEGPAFTRRTSEGKAAVPGQQTVKDIVSETAIMIRANQKWAAAGMPKGDGDRFWLEAERELRKEVTEQKEQPCTQPGPVYLP